MGKPELLPEHRPKFNITDARNQGNEESSLQWEGKSVSWGQKWRRVGGYADKPSSNDNLNEVAARLESDDLRTGQVIVMSGHETIRVLEVGVDAHIPAEEEGKGLEGVASDGSQSRGPAEANVPADEAGPDNPDSSAEATAAAVLNTALPAPVQAAPPVQASSPAQPRPPAQPQTLFQTPPLLQTTPAILPQPTAATATAPTPKPVDTPPQITVHPAGFAFSPGIVIGTLPWVVNSASVAAPAPAQSLQVQAVTPQLLLNAQGQVIATLASSPLPPPVAVRKPSTPESPAKSEMQPIQPTPAVPQPAVVIASPAPAAKPSASAPIPITCSETPTVSQLVSSKWLLEEMQPIQPTPAVPQPAVVIASPAPAAKPSASAPIPITCSETPTVSQLVSKPHTPSLDEDGINLEEIREFAKNFKIRRLSLGLTQTQVGQALTATEGPAYSQSAICRFEKLDITPKSAQKLKPVLEKWLNEAELRNQEGQQNLMEFVGGEPSKKRKRRTSFTPQAIESLNAYFEKNPLPTGQEITEIAKELNYDREVVRVWFCNRRQTLKNTSKLNVFQIP
ncbi:POU domain, class 6, transcription factor 1 [Pteropus alecto]|uniref:POU domain protein n=1 Tax=Pteropus alecto TaxID=9402 RepID=L5L7L0_PTEAL|nr:POU domain, class 6, transcription factor 1 [Pteropus alecto]